ncbi:MAG TPA: hypothetical protein VJ916_04590 [Anaerovoracaceae bacterium]|nr:hypothetical protein [Anaerovoracaceae bacterium]
MGKNIKLKWNTNNKGSYIVETTICLPFYLIALLVLTTIILMYSTCENVVFSVCDEMRLVAIESREIKINPVFPIKVKERIYDENHNIKSLNIIKYRYHESYKGINDIIDVNIDVEYKNPLGFISKNTNLELKIMTRSYIGEIRDRDSLTRVDFTNDNSEVVYIFPNYGECYHNKNCYLVQKSYEPLLLTNYILKKYTPCDICNSDNANLGDIVYIFPKTGTNYHMGDCDLIEREYFKIDKKVAIERGYVPCLKCGG